MHNVLMTEGALLTVMQTTTMTMMMKMIAIMVMTTADTIERAVTTTHNEENGTNLPHHRDALPLCTSNDRNLFLPTLQNTIKKRWLNDKDFCIQVGRSMSQSLTILGLGFGASETEIKVHYQQLVRKHHPDKNDPTITSLNAAEASSFFQLLNNAHQYLKDRA